MRTTKGEDRPPRTRPPHARRRRLLLLWSVLPVLLLALLAVRLLLLPVQVSGARADHLAGDGPALARAGERLGVANPVERWRAPFVEGTGRSTAGDLAGGRRDLERSLGLARGAHADCTVRTNLVLTVSAQAAAAAAAGDTGTEQARAQEVLALTDAGPVGCLDGSDDGHDGEAGRAQQQARSDAEQRLGADEEPRPDPSPSSSSPTPAEPTRTPEPTPDPQERELQERNEQGQAEAQAQRRADEQRGDRPPDPVERPW